MPASAVNEIAARNRAALRGKPDRELRDLIAAVLSDRVEHDRWWELLHSPDLLERTVMLLAELTADVDGQFAVAKQQNETHAQWNARARHFKYLVTMRLGRAKLALKEQNLGAMQQAQAWQRVAHRLAAAIVEHERELSVEDDRADRTLWAHLDTVRRPDGQTVRTWMALTVPKVRHEATA